MSSGLTPVAHCLPQVLTHFGEKFQQRLSHLFNPFLLRILIDDLHYHIVSMYWKNIDFGDFSLLQIILTKPIRKVKQERKNEVTVCLTVCPSGFQQERAPFTTKRVTSV